MKKISAVLLFILCIHAGVVYGSSQQGHEFKLSECILCHADAKNAPPELRPDVSSACFSCHRNVDEVFSHPTDMYPYNSTVIPEHMPLMDGKLTCYTCHYVHPRKNTIRNTFTRKIESADIYCKSCHRNDKREHTAIGKAHISDYTSYMKQSMDYISKLCIECHDRKMIKSGAGFRSRICPSQLGHPVGISMSKSRSRNKGTIRSMHMLSGSLRMYDGKIGCGTCHNIYSQTKNLLVMENTRSRLCLECHIK